MKQGNKNIQEGNYEKLCAIICLILLLCCVSGIALAEGGTEQPEPAPSASAVEVFRTAEDFAGMYLDEAQQFVVCIVNLNAAREAELKALVPDGKVIFKSAKYSYAELKNYRRKLRRTKTHRLPCRMRWALGLMSGTM